MVTNSAINQTTAAAGKILQGAGVGIASTFSTPTYPSTSGTSRKILVSDGTDNVYSTETWAVPGTTGNVLTSDGTNWTSAVPPSVSSYYLQADYTLTSAEIKSLNATPITLIAAQGAGTSIQIVTCLAKFNYGGSNVFVAGAAQSVQLRYNDGSGVVSRALVCTNTMLTATTSTYHYGIAPTAALSVATSSLENVPIVMHNPIATEISGNAAGDNTLTISVIYQVFSI